MNDQIQVVLQKLEALRVALNAADAVSSSGWIKALYNAVEDAHVRATSEAAIAQASENTG